MILINENYHLPEGTMWVCNDKYNGLTSIERQIIENRGNKFTSIAHSSKLKNRSIPNKYISLLEHLVY